MAGNLLKKVISRQPDRANKTMATSRHDKHNKPSKLRHHPKNAEPNLAVSFTDDEFSVLELAAK
ncbi:hypothetical protein EOG65_09920 [Salmonella enterica]|nr:hypothetical protein [Salmonella enterica]EBZ5849038.1 hypothetical protein [Salmonella enterica subsp. enterica serovar Blockley]